jgi:hypothetical protein
MGTACARHGICELALKALAYKISGESKHANGLFLSPVIDAYAQVGKGK